ncbi:MAG: hypothetical protein Kilf2KO_34860 [Rhodospirillales bacterium]
MEFKNISGVSIRKIRRARGLRQIDISAALDVDFQIKIDPSDIGEIERGVRGVKDFELCGISQILGVPVTDLLDQSLLTKA